jgi:exopolyphosphatase/guanosine-5'-triphosphate,3'-diphosphate pyrophosphatase
MIKNKTTLLTVDIGSNAMRATFFQKRGPQFVPVLKQRYSLRLGQDVFTNGIIQEEKANELIQAFKELWHLCYKHHVVHILAVGTSALREAKNGHLLIKKIEHLTGIYIKLITGSLEAKVIFEAVKKNLNLKKKRVAHIDIGGGSTEIIIAENEKIQKVVSLPLGSVRLLQNKNLVHIQAQITSIIGQKISLGQAHDIDYLIGTGGNFKSLIKVKNFLFPKSKKKEATLQEIKQVYEILTRLDFYQRQKQFGLKLDRADVIVPATYTVISLMSRLNIKKLLVIDVGLEDGLLEIFKTDFK